MSRERQPIQTRTSHSDNLATRTRLLGCPLVNIIDFHESLSTQVDKYISGNTMALADAISPYSDTRTLCRLLSAAIRERDWLAAAARRSYLHPNGFAKIVLLSDDKYQLRLHVWNAQQIGVDGVENIHNHRWDFSSLVILGGYRYQEFHDSTAGEPYNAYCYESQRETPSYSLSPLGQRTLACSFDAYLDTGSSYTLRTSVLHRVIRDPARTTATLVLQGPNVLDSVDVLAKASLPTGPTLPLPRLSVTALSQDMQALTEELSRA